jgi:serine/threonine protein kinase
VLIGERFRLEARDAVGGMGAVYRATDEHTGETVAVKLMHPGDDGRVERFAREAVALATLRHPAIVRYVAHGVSADGQHYLAMEWLEGEDLHARLEREGRLGVSESLALVGRIAGAVGAAHARGMVHRDLKPGNIFLVGGQIGRAKLLDFGIARLGLAAPVTRAGQWVGTPGYMAPEQVREGATVDARADVFALGCVL